MAVNKTWEYKSSVFDEDCAGWVNLISIEDSDVGDCSSERKTTSIENGRMRISTRTAIAAFKMGDEAPYLRDFPVSFRTSAAEADTTGMVKSLAGWGNLTYLLRGHISQNNTPSLAIMSTSTGQYGIPAAYIRSGTSKAVFLSKSAIPPPGPLRDTVLKRIMGSPDPMQIDGIGGTRVVTSKIAIVSPSTREGIDVDYEFAQVGISQDDIGYDGNCGNISSAVGPYAIDEGMIKGFRAGASIDKALTSREVRVWNTGTKKLLIIHVPTEQKNGKSLSKGNASIDGVPGTGAPILIDFRNTIGAALSNGVIPSGNAIDLVTIGDKKVEITVCDVANICVFVAAKDMGISGTETADQINLDLPLIARCKELRGRASQLLGMCKEWEKVDEQSPGLPMVVLVSPQHDESSEGHIVSRLLLNNSCHDSMAGTGSICTAACGWVTGSVVNRQLKAGVMPDEVFTISHPLGYIPVMVKRIADIDSKKSEVQTMNPEFSVLAIVRTSRRIMDGHLYVPVEVWDGSLPQNLRSQNSIKQPGNEKRHENIVPVTKSFSSFVADLQFTDLPGNYVQRLKTFLLDYIGVAAYGAAKAESSPHFVEAIHNLGVVAAKPSTVITKGAKFAPQYAALLNGAFAHSLDYDDTYAPGMIHPGVSVISAALSVSDDTSNLDLLTGIAAGYEVACRIGMALGAESYKQGFHITGTAGIFGSVSAICKLKHLDAKTTEMAFGLAGSKAAGSMQFLATGSWNKRLHPGFAAHDAVICVTLAEAGVQAAEQAIEGEFGLLQAYTPAEKTVEKLQKLIDGLGKEWASAGTAIKPFPACRMTHSAIVLGDSLRNKAGTRTVRKMKVSLSPHCVLIVGQNVENKIRAKNVVEGQFSVYFQLAVAWLHGSGLGWAAYDHLLEEGLNELTDRITVVGDEKYKGLETKITVCFDDGTELMEELLEPPGEPPNPITWETLQEKFESLAVPVYGVEKSRQIADIIKTTDNSGSIERLMALLG
ncbi:hypothetical protein V502_00388 [Pseudogymnoascus sp. VKM F-4520 (FW-2644)]|nr:hypothetical protein V502_00388 [Pseudogymnoascus sp. VKM F-4520 (FW-2644)]